MDFKKIVTLIKEKYTVRSARWMQKHFAALFNQVADPVVVLPPEDIICLKIAIYSYYPPEKRPVAIGAYQLENLFPKDNNICIYVNHNIQDLIIGFKGTDIMNINDILSDAQLILGVSGLDHRVVHSLQLYDKVQAKYPEYTKQICGHSLGGTIAYIVAKHREPKRCTVFNPGSSPNTFFIQMLTDTVQKEPWTQNVYTYKILGDIVSSFSYVGNTKVFRVNSMDPYYLHNMVHFIQPGVDYVPLEGFFPPPHKEHG
jgi:hypothetical protein